MPVIEIMWLLERLGQAREAEVAAIRKSARER